MIESEGICDDCGGPMEDIKEDIWYCHHCELYLEWHDVAWYYIYLDTDEVKEKIGYAPYR